MATTPRRVYWDACAWIAVIQREKIQKGASIEDREMMGRSVIEAAKQNRLEILTSTFCLAEVCKNEDVRNSSPDKIAEFFENDYILLVSLDKFVGERARALMLKGYKGLRPPDASHLATALIANVNEMHTYDGLLLDLNNQIEKADGTKLRICKPDIGAKAPLFQNDMFGSGHDDEQNEDDK